MSLFRPKSKITLNEKLIEQLDNFDMNDNANSEIYKNQKERKVQTFVDLVGDDVFYNTDPSDPNKSISYEAEEKHPKLHKVFKSPAMQRVFDIMIVLGLLGLIFVIFFAIFKFLV